MKQYLIIGGSTGIGRSLAEFLSKEAHVTATYAHTEPAPIANVNYVQYDVTNSDGDFSWLPESIDGLAYCVGSITLKPFARIRPEEFVNDFQKQTVGAISAIQAALPAMKAAGNASVVLFSTVAVQTGFPFHAMVASSKGAIEGLTRALAAELAPKIRVNAIAPSITQTPLAGALLNSPEKIEANANRHPLKKIGQPEDIAELAAFLLSEKSSWITGQIHHIDGGISNIKV